MQHAVWLGLIVLWRATPQLSWWPQIALKLHGRWQRQKEGAGMARKWCEIEFKRVALDSPHLNAVLFEIDGEMVWIPRSCLRDEEYDVSTKGDSGSFEIPEDFAIKKGLV